MTTAQPCYRCMNINSHCYAQECVPQNHRHCPAHSLGSLPSPTAPIADTYLSLFSLAVTVVNLPFPKFNKKLIEEKKKKGHFIPNNKRPIDFSIFLWAGEEIRRTGGRNSILQSSPLLDFQSSSLKGAVSPAARGSQPGVIFSALKAARIHSALLMTWSSAAPAAFGGALSAGATRLLPKLPLCRGALFALLSPQSSLRLPFAKSWTEDMARWWNSPCEAQAVQAHTPAMFKQLPLLGWQI